MAGTYSEGSDWATSYDERTQAILSGLEEALRALENYGSILQQAGYNHAVADHNANVGSGAPPEQPQPTGAIPGCIPTFPPSAGGPGNGLVDDGLELAAAVGIPVPDGDTGRLDTASRAWSSLAASVNLDDALASISNAVAAFGDTSTPELDFILDDLDDLQFALTGLKEAAGDLSTSCLEYKTNLDDLRKQLVGILEDLAVELAVTAAVAVAAAFISFGLGAAAGAAKSAHSVSRFAKLISEAVVVWNAAKGISRGVAVRSDLTGLRRILVRLRDLGKRSHDKTPPKAAPKNVGDLFADGRTPKASELEDYAQSQGWTRTQTADGPAKYVDENGVVRVTIKRGSARAPGSGDPHVELRNADGQRVDPAGNPVSRKSPDNHTPIEWDLP
ncbi:hypothetical protein [Rhodococcus triatomae]|nr:hypothetical protein G419_05467 [Rhodococcus triatomae BKS 15-14]